MRTISYYLFLLFLSKEKYDYVDEAHLVVDIPMFKQIRICG